MTEAEEDRCWNCGMVPKRWFDVTSPGLEQRLLCSNCFARTTMPRIYYGWPKSPSPDWDDDDEDEKPHIASEPVADRVSGADRVADLIFSVLGILVAVCVFGLILVGLIILADRF